jgi:transposase
VVAVAATTPIVGHAPRVVMLSAEGYSLREIAERSGVTQRTVCLWQRQYQGEGITRLRSRHRSGRPRRVTRRKELTQELNRTQPALPSWPGLPTRMTHDYTRHGTTSLFAALEVASGKVRDAVSSVIPTSSSSPFVSLCPGATPVASCT